MAASRLDESDEDALLLFPSSLQPPKMPPRSFVHAAPTTLPTISGPFCTSSSRAGATSGNATSKRAVTNLDELRQVTLTNLYHNGTLKGTSEGKQMEVRPFMQGLNDKVALWCVVQLSSDVGGRERRALGVRMLMQLLRRGQQARRHYNVEDGCDSQRCEPTTFRRRWQ